MEIDDIWDDEEDLAPFTVKPLTEPRLRRVVAADREKVDALRTALTAANARADAAEAAARMARVDALIPGDAIAQAVAEERSIWTQAIETYFDATAVMDVERHVEAIRAQGVGE